MMLTRITALCIISGIISACSIHDSDSTTYHPVDPLCARITQRLAGNASEQILSYRALTATERSHLLQEYNQLGCNENSDNSYDYPYDSLDINQEINNKPVAPPKIPGSHVAE